MLQLIKCTNYLLNLFEFSIVLKIHQVCSGTNDTDDRADASLAVAKLKEYNDVQFQTLHQRISDICEIIVFSNQTNTADFATTGPNVSGLGI